MSRSAMRGTLSAPNGWLRTTAACVEQSRDRRAWILSPGGGLMDSSRHRLLLLFAACDRSLCAACERSLAAALPWPLPWSLCDRLGLEIRNLRFALGAPWWLARDRLRCHFVACGVLAGFTSRRCRAAAAASAVCCFPSACGGSCITPATGAPSAAMADAPAGPSRHQARKAARIALDLFAHELAGLACSAACFELSLCRGLARWSSFLRAC